MSAQLEVEQLPPTKPSVTDMVAEYWRNHATHATEKKNEFLEVLRTNGIVQHACEIAKIHKATVYRWRESDPEFRAAWDLALDDAVDKVEHSLYDQAVSRKNVVATIFYLKGNRAKYRDRLSVDVNAVQGEIEQRLSALGDGTKDIIADVISSAKQLGGPSTK